ncbi:aldehyde dehydrogenase family protein [Arthrobacter sp. QXT-31]|uniref:aldehyde dehydrogenase family protein n=1 Tax=Arthrobacter sp. QXT-31 TaxID=1357915 RepID=UPI00214FF0F3|nr:aldehyde dehydrogenase family protein [Arthrobacter sp. QXT-31]
MCGSWAAVERSATPRPSAIVIGSRRSGDEEEAMARANEVPYGLAASAWTLNPQLGHDVASRLDAGTVWVDSHLVLANEMPWGL